MALSRLATFLRIVTMIVMKGYKSAKVLVLFPGMRRRLLERVRLAPAQPEHLLRQLPLEEPMRWGNKDSFIQMEMAMWIGRQLIMRFLPAAWLDG